jgi:hypothetical protein
MAKTDDSDNPDGRPSAFVRGGSIRMPIAVMVGLIVLFVVASLLAGGSKSKKKSAGAEEGVRALVLPTADRARTVVVPPCGTGTTINARNVGAQIDTPGATVVQVPQAERARVLLIPRCSASASKAGAKTVAQVPSSLFVLTTGAKTAAGTPATAGAAITPRSQLVVPSASEGDTVVVPPCTGTGRADRVTVLTPRAGSPTALIAPRC